MIPEYRIATEADFNALWDRNIAENPDEPMWPIWRQRFRSRIDAGQAVTFAVILGEDAVGEATLELDTGKDPRLCDGKTTAYLSALRICREFEGRGYMSRLVEVLEKHARARGICTLTIGVEADACRNREIYRHWGFREFLFSQREGDCTVLYLAKDIKNAVR